MPKVTLFWMDMIRYRLKQYPFNSKDEKNLVEDFLAPVLLMGTEAERDLNKRLKKSLQETKKEVAKWKVG